MYKHSLGIQRDLEHPGFKHFILKPTPDPDKKMTWAKGHYDSMYGRIKSEWKWKDKGWFYKVTVPANTTATLYLTTDSPKNITEDGKKLKKALGLLNTFSKNGEVVLELASGIYEFHVFE